MSTNLINTKLLLFGQRQPTKWLATRYARQHYMADTYSTDRMCVLKKHWAKLMQSDSVKKQYPM